MYDGIYKAYIGEGGRKLPKPAESMPESMPAGWLLHRHTGRSNGFAEVHPIRRRPAMCLNFDEAVGRTRNEFVMWRGTGAPEDDGCGFGLLWSRRIGFYWLPKNLQILDECGFGRLGVVRTSFGLNILHPFAQLSTISSRPGHDLGLNNRGCGAR